MRTLALALWIILVTSSASFGQDPTRSTYYLTPEESEKALEIIRQFTEHVCTVVEAEGYSGGYQLSGKLDADVNIFLRKFFGFRGAGAAERDVNRYKNVVRRDLADVLKANIECRKTVSTLLIQKLPSIMFYKAPPRH